MEQPSNLPLASAHDGPVKATLVPLAQRLAFLPRHFGTEWVTVENAVYHTMHYLCPHYSGGYWEFYDLSNGGALLVPSGAQQYELACDGNGYACQLSPLATGVAVCAMAYNHLAFRRDGQRFAEMYYRVRDFLAQQAEAQHLFALLD